MTVHKGLTGMRPLRPSLTDRNIYGEVPEADLGAQLEHMKQIPKESVSPSLKPSVAPLPEGSRVLGLRVEAMTHDGLRDGLPRLLDLFAERGVRTTLHAAFGPDRTGAAVLRLLRSSCRRAYSSRSLLSGVLLPARPTAPGAELHLRRAVAEGHEVGFLAWDCRAWESSLNRRAHAWAADQVERSFDAFTAALGSKPRTASSPGWLCNNDTLLYQENLSLDYACDCRGTDPFLPVIDVRILKTPQVPVTLPTVEEALTSRSHRDAGDYLAHVLNSLTPGEWPVLSLSADVDGRLFSGAVGDFLTRAQGAGIHLLPLRELLTHRLATGRPLPRCTLSYAAVDGRPGMISMQMFEV